MMKKGFIVTWFNAGRNYGQTLQAYALQRILTNLGCSVEHLNFGSNLSFPCDSVSFFKKYLHLHSINKILTQLKFDKFIYFNLKTTKYIKRYEDLCSFVKKANPDFVVAGSDQIWNPYNVEPVYYLAGMTNDRTRKIAYAVSLCDLKRKDKFFEYPETRDWVSSFDSIYTRENTGRSLIKELFNKDADVVLDPTMLMSGEEWISNLKIKRNSNKYILCYIFNITDEIRAYINERSKVLGCNVHYGNVLLNATMNSKNWSPVDFLEEIYNAEEVITDSFHGTVFSILFHKEFRVVDNGKGADSDPYYNFDRMETLLNMVNLQDRTSFKSDNSKKIDYQMVDLVLEEERNRCINLLKKSIF